MASGFSVTIGVIDKTGPSLDKASKGVDAYRQRRVGAQKALRDLDKTGREALNGILNPRATGAVADFAFAATGAGVKAGRAFRDIGDSVRVTADQLARFAPAIGTLGAVGTIAGVAALAQGFGRFGIQTTKTAAALDLGVKDVQAYGRAWEMAGLSADEFVQSHANLNKTLIEAQRGTNTHVIAATRFAQALGFGAVDLSRTPEEVRKQIAHVVKRMHLAGVNVESQMQFAEAFGISRDEISLLQRGGDAIQDLHDKAAATVVVSSELVERGKRLGESLIGPGQSAETAGYKIAGDLEPKLKPLIDGFKDLLDNIDKIPGGLGTAETALGVLFGLFTVEVAARMKTVRLALWGVKAALGGLAALSAPAWLLRLLGIGGGVGAFASTLYGGSLSEGEAEAIKQHPELYPTPKPVHRRHGDVLRSVPEQQQGPPGLAERVWNGLTNTWDWLTTPPATPAPTGPRQRRPDQAGANLLHPSAYTAISQAEGTFRRGQIDYDTLLGYGRWGAPISRSPR